MSSLDKGNKIALFNSDVRKSCFNKNFYTADLHLGEFIQSILRYLDRDVAKKIDKSELSLKDGVIAIMNRIPAFQRDADKWSHEMQQRYVFNVMRGYRGGFLSLYSDKGSNNTIEPCQILDGLQRITAICRFLVDQDMDFAISNGESISAKDLVESDDGVGSMFSAVIPIRVYRFDNECEVVDFYIEMNEGITHSESDIERAKKYRAELV